jgi:hypothetical protein
MHRAGASILILVLSASCVYAQEDLVLINSGIGGIRICHPLSVVDSVFPGARDTVLSINEVVDGWPAKVVYVDAKEWILFYGKTADMIWRITTNSPNVQTLGGPRAGMTLGDVQDDGLSFDTVWTPFANHELYVFLYEIYLHIQGSASEATRERTALPTGVQAMRREDRIVALSAGSGCVRVDQ